MRRRKLAFYKVVVMVLYMMFGLINAFHDPEWVTAPQTTVLNNYMVEYTLYERAVTWNDAARICALGQSHMLSLKNQETVDLVEEFKLSLWKSLKTNDYWSGLSEPAQRFFIWEDCTLLSNFQMFKGESYNKDELCYKVKKDTLQWESRRCSDKFYFACEKVIPGGCNEATILSSNNLVTFPNMSAESCKANCTQRDTCWSGISMNTGLCILLVSRTGTELLTDVTMFKKICVKEALVPSTQVTPPPPENKNLQPLLNCSSIPQQTDSPDVTTGVEDTTPDQVISPSPCILYETLYSTYNVTETVNETHTVVITDTINITVGVTQYINVTSTLMETVQITFTDIYSTMLCSASCYNGTYHYLSTDDPLLLEAIASMKKELTVNKKETSYYKRTLISAPDQRPSSKAIGYVGLVFIVVPLVLILFGDVPNLIRECRSFIQRCR